MKVTSSLTLITLVTLSLSITSTAKAQIKIGPNISVPPRQCIPGAINCDAEIHRENMRHNSQLYFQTPEKILQHFHRERTERACLERTITTPPPPIDRNCNQYLNRIDALNQKDPVIQQRELQQREIDRLFPNAPK
ncbi:hypothetical protein [Aphanothece sacrum]|uniref:Uncharacterized protein n=1 Tax=Aphanothece sacrum FPU1 TaxID=1920663 RepID=A0A401INB5_APHSA|nr:hypothetical protein [Aphanothece sacrum]GBF82728.1 hypothetical protein AsFPU1_4162 [Aphanothece sacrum FPU1]GBF84481.1 hypothetical protein AsFPU3_1530 [Aphanothece sacrum FPU3]